ncbi:MAG: c-type cytochrome, partial [Methylococcales bacterium]|nr:c-type cytochrome [Methylococcales bacterium]
MQVKIIIGTVAFMLTMVILGFAAIMEQTRMAQFTRSFDGRQIESGADLYYANCAECHGENGEAKECFDSTGESVGCKGLSLNNAGFICEENSKRMEARGWTGNKHDFINNTINAGRAGGVMPIWGQQYGGPLQEDQVEALTKFVLNYENEELCAFKAFELEWPEQFDDFVALTMDDIDAGDAEISFELPVTYPGDVDSGRELFAPCAACHGDPEGDASTAAVGPWQGDLAETGGSKIDGYSAEQYTYESILHPAVF